jgi:hypothetical protein
VNIDLQTDGELTSSGQVYIYGESKTSWTSLSEECDRCSGIVVQECRGWKAGDLIVLVGIGNGKNDWGQANNEYSTDERTIRIIDVPNCRITLDRAASQRFRAEMYNQRVPIYSEVLNMERSVRISGTSGIVTRQQRNGVMQMHYARVSNCGQLKLGAYCLHFHHMGSCPECSFVGNAVGYPSVNKGITIHDTSSARVEGNIVYRHKGAFMYIEDGTEKGNLIKDNALVCDRAPTVPNDPSSGCKLPNGITEHKDSDTLEQAGLYIVGVMNNFIGNHISGMENAFFVNFQGSKLWGDPASETFRKTCPQANGFGIISGHYFHNNMGFGFYYPHSTYPTRVETDETGRVTDWNSCLGFDGQGNDNSDPVVIQDHVELFHNFGAGGYNGGDTSFRNTTFAFGLVSNYYKTYRRGERTGPFCDGCLYIGSTIGPMLGGGSCMWELKDTVFEDTQQGLLVNHHCGFDGEWTGGLCASHFWLTGSSEWKGSGPLKLVNDGEIAARGYSDSIVHYKGRTYFNTPAAHPIFNTNVQLCRNAGISSPYCAPRPEACNWTACDLDDIRIVRIYSADRGILTVVNNDENVIDDVPYTPWKKHENNVRLGITHRPSNIYDAITDYQNGGMGYTFLVRAGQSYTLRLLNNPSKLPDLFTLEYSDIQMPRDSISLSVEGAGIVTGGPCTIESTHPRNWITPYGPYTPESGAWWQCRRWPVSYNAAQHRAAQQKYLRDRQIPV